MLVWGVLLGWWSVRVEEQDNGSGTLGVAVLFFNSVLMERMGWGRQPAWLMHCFDVAVFSCCCGSTMPVCALRSVGQRENNSLRSARLSCVRLQGFEVATQCLEVLAALITFIACFGHLLVACFGLQKLTKIEQEVRQQKMQAEQLAQAGPLMP